MKQIYCYVNYSTKGECAMRLLSICILSIIVAMVFCISSAYAVNVNTSGSGSFSSASGTLPNTFIPGQEYVVSLYVKAKANQWPMSVKAILKSKNWAGEATVLSLNGEIPIFKESVTLGGSIKPKTIQSWVAKSGTMWWEVTVTYQAPAIDLGKLKKPSESFKTSFISWAIK
jgi:hypothetical protein